MREVLDTLAAEMAERDAERGKWIQSLRLARGFRSAEAAARAAHVSHRTWQNWEAGKAIDEGNIPTAAKILQVSEDELRVRPLEAPSLMRNDSLRTHLDRIEAGQETLRAEAAAMRVELGALATQIAEMSQTLSLLAGRPASAKKSRKAR